MLPHSLGAKQPVPTCTGTASTKGPSHKGGAHGRPALPVAASKQATSDALVPVQPHTQFQKNLATAVRKKARARESPTGVADFMRKLRQAWHIFFPEQPADITPKEEGKHRLRMILVADRCGMNQSSLYEMKHSIVQVVSDYVELEGEDLVEVNVTMDEAMGTIYSVAMPVTRVKPQARVDLEGDVEVPGAATDGISMEWDLENVDENYDPSARFPYGC